MALFWLSRRRPLASSPMASGFFSASCASTSARAFLAASRTRLSASVAWTGNPLHRFLACSPHQGLLNTLSGIQPMVRWNGCGNATHRLQGVHARLRRRALQWWTHAARCWHACAESCPSSLRTRPRSLMSAAASARRWALAAAHAAACSCSSAASCCMASSADAWAALSCCSLSAALSASSAFSARAWHNGYQMTPHFMAGIPSFPGPMCCTSHRTVQFSVNEMLRQQQEEEAALVYLVKLGVQC